MKHTQVTLIIAFILSITDVSYGSVIPYFDSEVEVDGNLTDEVWNEIKVLSSFYNHFPIDQGLAENQTEVRIFHNGKKLFISAIYHDSEKGNNISSLKRDIFNDVVNLSDCFGIVMDPFNDGNNGYFFAVNASGVQFDALIGNINEINESWNTVWNSAAKTVGNDKYYEIAIPLDAINFNPTQNTWGLQFFTNDTKQILYTSLEYSPRNFSLVDLRYTKKFEVNQLPLKVSNRFSLLPSVTTNYQKDKQSEFADKSFTPSLDAQINLSSSLRLDATLNPDFSQIEVDQQVTNLTRFAINFPERRKFFLENSDLFNSLGTWNSNPFYSRRIGAETDILFGAKLSGNIASNTRVGILNVQTKNNEEQGLRGKNYTVGVARQNISQAITTTLFMVNNQQSNNYNRVIGSHLNFKSKNNKWTSDLNYAQAFTNETSDNNGMYQARIEYQNRKFNWNTSIGRVEKNHITETGFTPLLYNFDALANETTRETFNTFDIEFQLKQFPKNSKYIDWYRSFWVQNESIWNNDLSLRDNYLFISPFAIRFKDRSYVYAAMIHRTENLTYNFDFLQNGNFVIPDNYKYVYGRVGYWSPTNRKLYYAVKFEYGQFYSGTRMNPFLTISYRLLPRAVISVSYAINDIDLNEKGRQTFHLAKLTSEIYFSNRINWTTYFQYNTQANNFNINSRFQWEYKPLSYIYLVFSNNHDNELIAKDWGISFKINRRLDF